MTPPDDGRAAGELALEVWPDAEAAARRAAEWIAAEVRAAVQARGRCALALSGGRTPWRMLERLAGEPLPWRALELFQVDERVAPEGDPLRNLTHIRERLQGLLPPAQLHAMPVEARDLAAAAGRYARELERVAGAPAVLDLVHLGLGADGHTASLLPGDPVLELEREDVGVTRAQAPPRRMTLTFPALDRARRRLWLVTGSEKQAVLARLRAGDRGIPAGRVARERALLLADAAAAG